MTAPAETAASRYANPTYRWYALTVMMGIFLCHAMDRTMAGILIEPIKEEFGLTDAQAGFYSGTAFAIGFSTAVLPMGWLSDRVNRRNLLALAVAAWSIFTALGGLSRLYSQLLLTRIGVGVFESGAAPLSLPMLSDIFPPERRGFVMGIFYTSSNLGSLLAAAAGGLIAAEYGWRVALMVAGAPGLFFAVVMILTVQEPKRGGSETGGEAAPPQKAPPIREVFRFLGRNPAVISLMLAASMMALVSIIVGAWSASFFMRVHGFSLTQVGLIIGLAGGMGGVLSPPLYGWIADRLSARNPAWALRIVWVSCIILLAIGMLQLFTPLVLVAVACYAAGEFLRSGYSPPTYSVLMSNVPVGMRGTVMSMVQLGSNLMGFGLGPLLVGALSDHYGGGKAIRYAMANAFLIFIPVTILFILASWGLFRKRSRFPV